MKLRFPFRGQITTEDLWDLRLENLDDLYRVLSADLATQSEVSLLSKPSSANEETKLRIALVKHVVEVRLREAEETRTAHEIATRKQQLRSILARKQDAEIEGKSVKEIEKMIQEL